MAVEKWVAGAVTTWVALFGTEIDSLPNTNSRLSSVIFDNTANLDGFCEIAVNLGSITSASGYPWIGVAFYELGIDVGGSGTVRADGSVYGDGRFGANAAGVPFNIVLSIPVPPSVTGIVTWRSGKIALPLSKFKPVLYNLAGSTLAASSNNLGIKTFNRVIS